MISVKEKHYDNIPPITFKKNCTNNLFSHIRHQSPLGKAPHRMTVVMTYDLC